MSQTVSSEARSRLPMIEVPPFPPSAEYFEAAFDERAVFDFAKESVMGVVQVSRGSAVRIKRVSLGRIAIPSGEVLVTDPSYLGYGSDEERPLQKRVAPGDYEVVLSACTSSDKIVMINMVKLIIQEDVGPLSYVPALKADEDPSAVKPHGFASVGVDTGVACLADYREAITYGMRLQDHIYRPEGSGTYGAFAAQNEKLPGLVYFESGTGDGGYPCFWGIGPMGETTCLVVDFETLGLCPLAKAIFPLSESLVGMPLTHEVFEKCGYHFRLEHIEGVLCLVGDELAAGEARIYDERSTVIGDTRRNPSTQSGKQTIRYMREVVSLPINGTLEIEVSLPYKPFPFRRE